MPPNAVLTVCVAIVSIVKEDAAPPATVKLLDAPVISPWVAVSVAVSAVKSVKLTFVAMPFVNVTDAGYVGALPFGDVDGR